MMRLLTTVFLMFACVICVHAQKAGRWASAHERGLKGVVHTVISSCSDINGKYETRYKYEFARDGRLMVIEMPQFKSPIYRNPLSDKVTGRNGRGDIEEISYFDGGEVMEKERYEYEYDGAGNWVKRVTLVMRAYEMVGGDWPAGEWRARYVCNRTIEYYR